MHLGNVYAALLSWLSARSKGGQWRLRIEDIDRERSRDEYARLLMDDLHWLGLEWDGEVCYQSARSAIYEEQLQRLQQTGQTFACYLSRGEIMASSAPHEQDGRVVYGEALRAKNAAILRSIQSGLATQDSIAKKPAIRLRVPNETIGFEDLHYGLQSANLEQQCGDFILRRGDGAWAYQLAVVVDDALMGVTEVVRGRDLLGSVPQQLYLYRLLGFTPPRFAHIPLLCSQAGQRLCKRDKSLDMGELRKHLSAEEIMGRLAFYAGLTPTMAPIAANELVPLFDWKRIPTHDIYVS